MSDIFIYRSWPIVNGYVQIPNNQVVDKNRVTTDEALALIPGSNVSRLSMGSGKNTGSKHGCQEFFELPPVASDSWYTTNPVDEVG